MASQQIFYPVLAMLFLTMAVWVYMYAKRIPFINSLNIEPDKITPNVLTNLSPPSVSNPSDNLKNLFEIPVIFYVLAFYLYVTQQVDAIFVGAAWGFVCFRLLHSLVHCTFNVVMLRFALYLISSVSVFFMLIRTAYIALM